MKPYRWLVALLVVAVLGVIGAQWLAQQDQSSLGQVIVRTGGYDYSTTLPRALLLLVLAWLALGLAWSLLRLPFRAWGRYRKRQGRARLIEALRALQGGHWLRAERLFAAAVEDREVGAIALAGAVRAADGRGDDAHDIIPGTDEGSTQEGSWPFASDERKTSKQARWRSLGRSRKNDKEGSQ